MNGKTCVVTGATSGIGKATAVALARLGAQVVLVGRDRGRGEAAVAEVAAVSTSPPRLEIADLASMGQVRELGARLSALDRIDVLVNNAGRSEEHTSELQSRVDLVCRLLLEKKKEKRIMPCHLQKNTKKRNEK